MGLNVYDLLVVRGFAPLIWGCEPQRVVDHYNQFVTANHVDIGVGTGFFLDRCRFPENTPRLALVDQRKTCLDFTARRLARYSPQTWQRDVTVPFDLPTDKFDSLCLGGILHCLNGTVAEKARVFDHITPLLCSGARVFGYTLVQNHIEGSLRRQSLNYVLNQLRVISNRSDTHAAFSKELYARFSHCRLEHQGAFLLFSARYCP